jgi:hypothetical protein
MINNFRQYILNIRTQIKLDMKKTKDDIAGGKKRGLTEYHKGFYDGAILQLKQIYDDCKKYEWIKR